jgi:hypothetical protein
MTELSTFEASSEKFWRDFHLRLVEVGKGGEHLLFKSNLAQFEGL